MVKAKKNNPLRDADGRSFGDRLIGLMGLRDMSQADLANVMKVGKATVNQWILGSSEPSARAVLWLAEFFKTDVRYLLIGRVRARRGDGDNGRPAPLVQSRKPRGGA